jgi:hypothetical protein
MTDVDEYRRYAAQCLELARRATEHEHRLRFLQMAQRWNELADRAEASQTSDHC